VAARISSACAARPSLPAAIALVLVLASLPLWLHLPRHLGIGALEASAAGRPDVTVSATPDPTVPPRVASVAIGAARAQLESDPAVASVDTPGTDGGATAQLLVQLTDDSPASRLDSISGFRAEIDPGPLTIEIGGPETRLQQLRARLGGDLWRIAVLVLPFALLLLSALSGWRWAVCSLLAAVAGFALSMALLRLLGCPLDVSLLAAAVAAPVAIAAAIEVALALAYRAFDLPREAGRGDRLEAAVSEGVRDGLTWALFAAVAGVLALLSGFEQASALAVGALCGALGGLAAGLLVGVAALAAGASLPLERFEAAGLIAGRLTGGAIASRQILARAITAVRWALLLIMLAAAGVFAYLLRDTLGDGFDALALPGTDGAALACALVAGLTIVAGRSALSLRLGREASQLGATPAQAAATTAQASLGIGLGAGLLLAVLGVLMQITDVGAAREFGVTLAAIVLADCIVGRLACAALPAKGPFRGAAPPAG
jgi:hypothetical protein